MELNFQQLRVLCAVVKYDGFTAAAAALHVSQPAVSKMIKDLEKNVGMPLLERRTRPVKLTETGKALHEYARSIFEIERMAIEDLQARKGLEHGSLWLGASTTIATYWLPPIVSRFVRAYPGVDVHLVSENTRHICEFLLDHALDVALVEGPVDHPKLRCQTWREDELVLVASPAHPLTRRKRILKKDLQNINLVMREEGSGTRDVIENALKKAGVSWNLSLEIGGTTAIKQVVAAGFGAAFVPRMAAQDQIILGTLQILPIKGFQIKRPLSRLLMRGRPVSIAARRFEEMLMSADE